MRANICKFGTVAEAKNICIEKFIYETDFARLNTNQPAEHERVILVCSGYADYVTPSDKTAVNAGTLIFTHGKHTFRNAEDFTCIYIDCFGERVRELYIRFGITPFKCVFGGFEEIIPVWKDGIIKADSENTDLISESMLLYAFSMLNVKSSDASVIAAAMRYIDDHFTETDLSLSGISAELGYNAKYLSHLFKAKTGTGFSEYLKNLRIKHAVFLMEQGVTTVKNIAFLSGFSDPLYFSNVFTGTFGMRPTEYMKNLQKNN